MGKTRVERVHFDYLQTAVRTIDTSFVLVGSVTTICRRAFLRASIDRGVLPQTPSFTTWEGMSTPTWPLFSQKNRPFGHADVPGSSLPSKFALSTLFDQHKHVFTCTITVIVVHIFEWNGHRAVETGERFRWDVHRKHCEEKQSFRSVATPSATSYGKFERRAISFAQVFCHRSR